MPLSGENYIVSNSIISPLNRFNLNGLSPGETNIPPLNINLYLESHRDGRLKRACGHIGEDVFAYVANEVASHPALKMQCRA